MLQLKCNKVVTRNILNRGIRIMYIKAEIHEVILDNTMVIQYINKELKDIVRLNGEIKLMNNIANVILTWEDGAVMATFNAMILDQLVVEPISDEGIDIAILSILPDDQYEICGKSKIYSKLSHELDKRVKDFEVFTELNIVDVELINALQRVKNLIDLASGKSQTQNNIFMIADKFAMDEAAASKQ